MSDYCFAKRYFATRDQLSRLMQGIAKLAAETTSHLDPPLPLDNDGKLHDHPSLFIVLGEINTGKSSFINGLIGHPLCPVSDLPQSQPISHYQFGSTTRDDGNDPITCQRPLGILREFHFVDTPGITSIDQALPAALNPLLESATLVFCVLPATNPWTAATWNTLSRMPDPWLAKTVLIVQQADQRSPQDLPVIKEHITDLAGKKLGHSPAIFTVSANQALQAKQATPVDRSLLSASGYTSLESFISDHIEQLESRKAALQTWQQQATAALATIDEHLEAQSDQIRDHTRFMEQVEGEICRMRETFIHRLPSHLIEVAETFEKEAAWVTKRLRRKLSAIRSISRLFIGDRTSSTMENAFIERIRSAVESVAQKDGIEVAEACRMHWSELKQRVRESAGVPLTANTPIDETLESSREFFIKRLGRAAEQGINNLKVRNQLDKDLRRRNLALKSFTSTALIFIIAGSTCGALDVPWAPYILISIAAVFACGGILAAWVTRKAIARAFHDHLLDTCSAYANTLHGDYEEALHIVFRDYSGCMSDIHDHFAREKLAIEPRQRAWQNLFLTLKTIEQDN